MQRFVHLTFIDCRFQLSIVNNFFRNIFHNDMFFNVLIFFNLNIKMLTIIFENTSVNRQKKWAKFAALCTFQVLFACSIISMYRYAFDSQIVKTSKNVFLIYIFFFLNLIYIITQCLSCVDNSSTEQDRRFKQDERLVLLPIRNKATGLTTVAWHSFKTTSATPFGHERFVYTVSCPYLFAT